ncbi:hypothetical protein Z948_1926 [Sulfitobacter donghicola DSW-25 = KCTC 12864 = JCM 14565]|uniref:Uncharacterized protein n=1 Tax=Sulfitobacter donghicola DSW-25 = KCTC 12864 = JCM 14565 TaxID=1300350 RepID=A0A073J0B3_9RHOB|nr:hypothetical protein DSW25_03175 [Sulfitobacter donghicola DSW-25 = KCTC 12864 = JCM 14565]KIN68198.1 hypothetical protein Z948_1926 [Sulfitobacter donghicola DSW-25 = KCTC 12864 = JCM 14565]
MYQIGVAFAAYLDWWARLTKNHPARWEAGLWIAGAVLTILPMFVGNWAYFLWPLGWLCIPGLLFASKEKKRVAEIHTDRTAGALKTKTLISVGQQETKK